MVSLADLQKISDDEWVIPMCVRKDMTVPVRLFATRSIIEAAIADRSLEQAINVTTLPGLVGDVVVMPDVHQGYGFPIGGVAATAFPEGVISPGGIGYDINCGVRLLGSSISIEDAFPFLSKLAVTLDEFCPSGTGTAGTLKLSNAEFDIVCKAGAKYVLDLGMGDLQDLLRTEDNGCMTGALPDKVSLKAKARGCTQLGTLGSGNHFIEVGVVDKIYQSQAAQDMGLFMGCLTLMIHTGSRGFGHQICTDYVQNLQVAVQRLKLNLPDRELVCAPLNSAEGSAYLGAMRAAANFAYANRQVLIHQARKAFEVVFRGKVKNWHLHQIYDISHNIGRVETHKIRGKAVKVCVHRKGATSAFGPGTRGLPSDYLGIGQPIIVPGSMGTSSRVLTGTNESKDKSFSSACHGAGRILSRSEAKRTILGEKIKKELSDEGIIVLGGSLSGLAEEAPRAYKDVDEVVDVVCAANIARKVACLRPLVVIKG